MIEPFLSLLLGKLRSLIEQEVGFALSVKKELMKLEDELNIIGDGLQDADLMHFSSEQVRTWLGQLKDAAYDAEDILDEYGARILQITNSEHQVCNTPCSPFSSCKKIGVLRRIGCRIREVSSRLNEISSNKDKYGLDRIVLGSNSYVAELNTNRQTSSVLVESEIIGRDEDADIVTNWLLDELDAREENVSIISIVGIGGLGKTTLAKKVYNSMRIGEHFEKSMWVYVSEKPRPTELAKKILDEVNRSGFSIGWSNITELNTLYTKIIDSLRNKRFLLVLDDVWNVYWWQELKSPLQSGAPGSKILVTSRTKHPSVEMGAVYIHELRGLPDDQSWSLFLRKALKEEETEQDLEALMLKETGKEIVKKLDGLPLAVKTIGSVMRSKRRTWIDWQAVLNSRIWDCQSSVNQSILLPALLLSYNNLPMYLKRCFVFCSVFPKNFWIHKIYLIRLWMAEGFVLDDEGREMEVRAEDYIEDLIGCCLFQDEKRDENGNIIKFKMHAVIHDLALYLSGKEYVETNSHARHLSLIGKDQSFDESLGKQKYLHLRTLLLPDTYKIAYMHSKFLINFKLLRVLDLSDNDKLSKLPDSIGDLILLRYLNLSNTKLEYLPQSVSQLCNLQTLQLGRYIRELPKGISALCSLRNLEFDSSLSMPRGTMKLTCLRTLTKFVVGRGERECGILELKNLNKLKGCLVIEHLERVKGQEEARQAELSNKENLQSLELWWEEKDENKVTTEELERMEEVLEALQPPMNLVRINICDFLGKRFPTWIQTSTILKCLREVLLYNCKLVEHLPPLGKLPFLKRLYIFQVYKVRKLNSDFHAGDDIDRRVGFEKLEELSLLQMSEWEDWSSKEDIIMPCLKNLYLTDCPKLKALPEFFQSLETLTIYRCFDLYALSNMPVLMKLEIRGCQRLQALPCLPSLVSLYMDNLSNWEGCLETAEGIMPRLQSFYLRNCPKLTELPYLPSLTVLYIKQCEGLHGLWQSGRHPTRLESLEIVDCPIIQTFRCPSFPSMNLLLRGPPEHPQIVKSIAGNSLSDELAHLTHLKIENLPELCSLPETLLNLTSLEIDGFSKFSSLMTRQQLGTKLKRVSIKNCSKLTSLPEQLQYLTEFQSLSIGNLHDICSLPEWLQNLRGLKSLVIKDCPNISSLPSGMQKLTALQVLEIDGLPELDTLPEWLADMSKLVDLKIKNCLTEFPTNKN
ncbi:PREDICTED: disease resistance protein RGA2-like [Nelumbo nucifera]|uniref:Disease resistance protein RGA2-like n=2 Tax=Nelumbo nucifera TaxID=4432 RepID=A0A1U7ZIK0_NELNU|nr:PREDICTED: disease resistance protein RGA2-like [Nelumbo nucifera]DAD34446.1 TPA_asm: hypothetical protein HUJ06_005086 [Nelumbo nucifera]